MTKLFGGYAWRTKNTAVRVNPEEKYYEIERDYNLGNGQYRFNTSSIEIKSNPTDDKNDRPFLLTFTKPASYRRIMVTLSEEDFRKLYKDMSYIIKELD